MRVLILSQYYYPEPVEKVHDLAKGLASLGHTVKVITGLPCYPAGKVYPGYGRSLVSHEVIDGIEVTRIPQLSDHSRSALRRAAYYFSFAFSAATFGAFLAEPADVMVVYQAALPIGLGAWAISRLRRIPMVADVVDLWPESMIASGMVTNQRVVALVTIFARLFYRSATRINVITDGYRGRLEALGVPTDKMSVIRHWTPAENDRRVAPDPELARLEGMSGRFNVVYAGNMGPCQDLGTVVRAASLLRDLSDVQFVFVGDGLDLDMLRCEARTLGLDNVRFLGRRLPAQMPSYYALADALLVHLKPDDLSVVSLPSKMFTYMAAGRPLLVGVKGEAEEFTRENGFGLVVPPSNPVALADAVRQLHDAAPELRAAMGRAALHAHATKYCSSVQVAKFADLLTSAVRGN